MKRFLLTIAAAHLFGVLSAQMEAGTPVGDSAGAITSGSKRSWIVAGGEGLVAGGSLYLFFSTSNYRYSKPFHTISDGHTWLQMDKGAHFMTAGAATGLSISAWKWAGVSGKKAVWLGALSSTAYLSAKEFLDGHHPNWGWSWMDMGANFLGIAAVAGQEAGWREQRIRFKASAHPRKYEASLGPRINDLFGTGPIERLVKDYNGQTFWMSVNPESLFGFSRFPSWLNVAVGYGADGLLGNRENRAVRGDGTVVFDRTDIPRRRQWYLSPDLDLSRIPTRKKGVKVLLTVLNLVKIPAPALAYSGGKLNLRWLYF